MVSDGRLLIRMEFQESTVEFDFADGVYIGALPLPQIKELETKCGIGIGGLFARVYKGGTIVDGKAVFVPSFAEFYISDIVETIRQGLIGGGKGIVDGTEITVTPSIANRLIANYVEGKPLAPNWAIAAAILGGCIRGYDPPKKAEPANKPAKEPQTAA